MRHLYIFFLFLICSCDPGAANDKIIENQTNYILEIKIFGLDTASSRRDFKDSIVLNPSAQDTVSRIWKIGHAIEFEDCNLEFDSLSIQALDTNLTFIGQQEWNFKINYEKRGRYSSGECRFIVRNNMFQ